MRQVQSSAHALQSARQASQEKTAGQPTHRQASAHTNATDPQLLQSHKTLAHKCKPCCSEHLARRSHKQHTRTPKPTQARQLNASMHLQHLQNGRQHHNVQTITSTSTTVPAGGAHACQNTPGDTKGLPTHPANTAQRQWASASSTNKPVRTKHWPSKEQSQ